MVQPGVRGLHTCADCVVTASVHGALRDLEEGPELVRGEEAVRRRVVRGRHLVELGHAPVGETSGSTDIRNLLLVF